MNEYLAEKEFIDISNVKNTALDLTKNISSNLDKSRILYHFVRDEIKHSADIDENRLTKYASEVLKYKHGICFSKSILLVALIRSIGIPAGFGYQKLILDDEKYPWLALHGYAFIYSDHLKKWIKVDPRGNKAGINAEFSIDIPEMAFETRTELGEADQNINHPYPIENVTRCLKENSTRDQLWKNLPKDF